MADATHSQGVYHKQGGNELVIASNGQLTVEAANVFQFGTQANTSGSGLAISSSATGVLKIFGDDGGANIGTSARNIQGRTLLTVDQSGGSIRSVQGQLKLATGVDVTTGIYTGVQGYVEMAGTHVAQTGSTFSCIDASMEIVTSLTVNSGGEACGIHVETTGAGTITNNGTCAAILVSNASGAAAWPVGLAIVDSDSTTGISIGIATTGIIMTGVTGYAVDIATSGAFRMGVQGTGIPVVTATPFAMEVHTQHAADVVQGATGRSAGIRSRYEISVAQTTQISLSAVEARLRVKAGIADGEHAGLSASIEGDDSIAYTGTSTTNRSAGTFTVEMGTGSTLSAGFLCGVSIDSSVHSAVSMASVEFIGLRIKTSSSKEIWEHGIYIDDSGAVTGITLGTCTTGINLSGTMSTGINLSGTFADGQALIAGGFGTPISFTGNELVELHGRNSDATNTSPLLRCRCSAPASTDMTTGEVVSGQFQAYGTDTSDVCVLNAVQGHCGIKAACEIIADKGTMPNMLGGWFKIEDLGFDLTLTGDAAALGLGMQFNAGTTLTGAADWIFLAKEGTLTGGGGVPDAVIRGYDGTGGGLANFLLDIPASLPYDAANSSGSQSGKIACNIGGSTKYIQCYSD